jgi:ABC-type antimicrobial peptide transport system permease subunit
MTRVREGKIKYKITDNLYIYNKGKADFLVYVNAIFKDTNNIDEHRIEEMINRGWNCEFILNMNDVENSVNKLIRLYIEALRREISKELDITALYIFMLKFKLYVNYIKDALLAKGLYDQYKMITEDNNFIYVLIDYLLNKRKSELTLQKWGSILKDINVFYELYHKVTYFEDFDKDFTLYNYNKFKETLANMLKSYQSANTANTNQ